MKLNSPLLNAAGGLVASAAVRHWMGTLQCRLALYDRRVDPANGDCDQQRIYVFWHEYLLMPFSMRGHCNMAMLASRHLDAEILTRAAGHMGYDVVRGSSGRGGVAALRQLLAKSRQMHLGIASDGPRGPRRRLSPGPIFLASKLAMPLVFLAFGYDRPWRMRTWDRFALPRPFSRGRCIGSPDIHVPGGLDRAGLEHFRQRSERLLNRLTREAEAWAESGRHKIGEEALFPRRRLAVGRRVDPAHDLPGGKPTVSRFSGAARR